MGSQRCLRGRIEGVISMDKGRVQRLRWVGGRLAERCEFLVFLILTACHCEHQLVFTALFSDALFVLFDVVSVLLEIFLK